MCRLTGSDNWEETSFVLRHLGFIVDEESLQYLDYEWMSKNVSWKDNSESNVINGGQD